MALKPASLQWADEGTFRSADFGDIYFQPQKGREESYYVFLEQNGLPERFSASLPEGFCIAELGFGTGLNFLLTAQLWAKNCPSGQLTYASIEKHPILKEDLKKIFSFWPELKEYSDPLLEQYPPLIEGFHHLHFPRFKINLMLLFGDVAETLPQLEGNFDAWYLDGFSPAKNPGMWDKNIFPLIAARTKAGGSLTSFSSAGEVRRGLGAAGFEVKKEKGFGTKRDMTVAQMPKSSAPRKKQKKNVVVLGAGIAGASAAYALAQKGYEVTVIDRQPNTAGETSGNPVGIVYPKMTADPSPLGLFHQQGFCFTRNLVSALKLPSWDACGVVHLDINDEERKRHKNIAAGGKWPEEFIKYETGRGLHQPLAGYLSPPEFCQALLNHPDITTRYSTEIDNLDFDAEAIVIALGMESTKFTETTWLPLQSLRGQITYLKPTPESKKISSVICHDGYITPVINGLHYIGATFQKEKHDVPEVRAADHQENLDKLDQYIPGLGFWGAHIVGGRAGYRATTPDKLPLIGRCPDYTAFIEEFSGLRVGKKEDGEGRFLEKVYISTGFGAHGMTGAPLAGEMIASMISRDPLPVPQNLAAYLAPERFILRDLKRRRI